MMVWEESKPETDLRISDESARQRNAEKPVEDSRALDVSEPSVQRKLDPASVMEKPPVEGPLEVTIDEQEGESKESVRDFVAN